MAFQWLIFIHFVLLLQCVTICRAQTPANTYRAGYACSSTGNFTACSTYQSNLHRLLSSLSSRNDIDYGFYNISEGQDGDKVSAIGLCRGDVVVDTCLSCLNQSNYELLQFCPAQKEAIIWFDNCMLRYSDQSIFGHPDDNIIFRLYNVNNVTNVTQFDVALSELLVTITDKAASGDSTRKFATGEARVAAFQRVYALVQCTPDLTQLQCSQCLTSAIRDIAPPSVMHGKIGARILSPSCNFRFESNQFFNPAPPPPPPPTPASAAPQPPSPSSSPTPFTQGNASSNIRSVILIVVPVVVGVIVIFTICICLFAKARKSKKNIKVVEEEIMTVESLRFDLVAIKDATCDFSLANKLGEGGFGTVYKGTLPNGQKVAVKRLSSNSEQGEEEFKNEVLLVAKLQHRNLVKLQGFCLEGHERILMYEFVPNRSLDQFIFDHTRRLQLKWDDRLKIIVGIARGLLYLHEDSRLRIIHRDLKASNVLLDEEMNPKISDFGMARLFSVDETRGITSRIVGTYGYMAPEYARQGQFSVRSDVYSFGVLVLEIVSGQKNNAFEGGERSGSGVESLISYAWKSWRKGTAVNIVDPTIHANSTTELMRCIHIGLLCVQDNVEARPNMASVLVMLNSFSLTLPIPSQPGFFMHSIMEQETTQHNSGTKFSANEASLSEFYPR